MQYLDRSVCKQSIQYLCYFLQYLQGISIHRVLTTSGFESEHYVLVICASASSTVCVMAPVSWLSVYEVTQKACCH